MSSTDQGMPSADEGSDGLAARMSIMTQNSPLDTIVHLSTNIEKKSFANEGERAQALRLLYGLVDQIETPWEKIVRLCMGQPALGAALKVAKDLELFEKWHAQGDVELTNKDLAAMVKAETALLTRLLRHLAANHVLLEVSINVFKPTNFSRALLEPVFGEWINYLYDAMIPCYQNLPSWLADNSYKEPTDPSNGIFQAATGWKGGDLFAYYDAHPREGASFNHVMGGVMAHQASWLDIYPHEEIATQHQKTPNLPLIVDVGGNIGHDLDRFRAAHPETATQLYLQDRADVVKLSKCPETVNKVVYDFFTPQPVEGARIYYMHGVLHDWPDEHVLRILRCQRPAMKLGFSKLIVHDHVVQEARAHPHATAYDLTMMVKVAGVERTEKDWRRILALAGFRVLRILSSPLAVQGIIEAEPSSPE